MPCSAAPTHFINSHLHLGIININTGRIEHSAGKTQCGIHFVSSYGFLALLVLNVIKAQSKLGHL